MTTERKPRFATHTTRSGATCRVVVLGVTSHDQYRKAHVMRVERDGTLATRQYAVDADSLAYEDES